ncbi:hypothetical protein HMPREF1318_2688 [Actinomyces massiliensis F0489]|uniref:Uncharacterized protein n=1 Tax=Actinomyces massiliensis F0489 TaxID=1125718 RepID=J1H260_9ACTO|nr:hypothetical protein HMPREF1318_2688 [Actinomyces massiliensis F0489]
MAPEGRVGRPERADVERADADVERVVAGELRLPRDGRREEGWGR